MTDYLMSYDALHELCTRIGGRYVAWANQAATTEEHDHWIAQAARLRKEAWEIDPADREAVEAKRAEWRKLFHSLSEQAPVVAV